MNRKLGSALTACALSLIVANCGGGRYRDTGAPPPGVVPPAAPAEAPDIVGLTEPSTQQPPRSRRSRTEESALPARGLAQAAVVPPARAVARWTSYKQFSFAPGAADLPASESGTVSEIAGYLARNPALHVGIDGSDTRDAALGARRVASVRDALVKAGVPAARIESGAFSNARIKRDRGVEVLLINR